MVRNQVFQSDNPSRRHAIPVVSIVELPALLVPNLSRKAGWRTAPSPHARPLRLSYEYAGAWNHFSVQGRAAVNRW